MASVLPLWLKAEQPGTNSMKLNNYFYLLFLYLLCALSYNGISLSLIKDYLFLPKCFDNPQAKYLDQQAHIWAGKASHHALNSIYFILTREMLGEKVHWK